MTNNKKEIDYLTEDPIINSQQYCLVSFVSPEGFQKGNKGCFVGIKIRGCFPSIERANKKVKELKEIDDEFDIYLAETGKWLEWEPEDNELLEMDEVYDNPRLNELIKNYKIHRKEELKNFESELNKRVKLTEYEGSKEYQNKLADSIEHKQKQISQMQKAIFILEKEILEIESKNDNEKEENNNEKEENDNENDEEVNEKGKEVKN
jgi:hypothetical protein